MAGGRFSVEAIFKAVDHVTAPVTRMQNSVGKFTRRAKSEFTALSVGVDKVSAGLKKIAATAAIAGVMIAAVAVPALAAGADFEQAITNVGAVSLSTRAEIAPLEQMALELGRTTKFTATQAANAMEILARAGFKNNEILNATPGVLSAAAASGLEIAEVADHVAKALRGMGMEAENAGLVADVLTVASSKTNSTIGSLGEALSNVSATARQFKIPLKDTVAWVAALQNVGLDASTSGTALSTALTKMAKPTDEMQKKMRRMGITFQDAHKNMLPPQKVLEQFGKMSDSMTGNMERVAFVADLVGLRGQKAVNNLMDLFKSGDLTKLREDLEDVTGKAKEMADLRMNTVHGSLLLLQSAVDGVKVRLFDMNSGPLKRTIDRMTAWVSKNDELIAGKLGGWLSGLIEHLGAIATALKIIGTGLAVFYTFATAVKIATVAMTAFNFAMSMNPISLIIIAIAALVTGILWLMNHWEQYGDLTIKILKGVGIAIGVLLGPIGWIGLALAAAAKAVYDNWEPIKGFFSDLWGGVVDQFKTAMAFIMAGVEKAQAVILKVKGVFGFGDESEDAATSGPAAQMVSPQERVSRSIQENNSISRSEVTIMDQTGRAEVTGGGFGPGLELLATGAF